MKGEGYFRRLVQNSYSIRAEGRKLKKEEEQKLICARSV